MLEQFKVPEDIAVHVQEDALRETVKNVFMKMGVNDADSELATDVLVVADMRGVETHGVSNMLRSYVTGYGSGELNNNLELAHHPRDSRHRQHRLRPGLGHHRHSQSYGDSH